MACRRLAGLPPPRGGLRGGGASEAEPGWALQQAQPSVGSLIRRSVPHLALPDQVEPGAPRQDPACSPLAHGLLASARVARRSTAVSGPDMTSAAGVHWLLVMCRSGLLPNSL